MRSTARPGSAEVQRQPQPRQDHRQDHRQLGRPSGTYGPVAQALLDAARRSGPAPVATLAARAGVGFAAARCTASRLLERGALVRRSDCRPALLDVPHRAAAGGDQARHGGDVCGGGFADVVLDVDAIELLTVSMWRAAP